MPIVLKVGDVIDAKYKVIGQLGAGGMGAVVRAQPLAGGEVVALKYCFENSPELIRRFAREVRIMQGITHKHVVRILDANDAHAPPYFTMPLAERSLASEIPALKTDEDAALDAFLQVCLGVQAIHNSLGVHRDIKPMNALRYADGTIAVSDLGLAKYEPRDTTPLTQTAAFLGTRAYCAPEQLLPAGSREADGRTDIYQLGKTLYELVTGKSPALIDRTAMPAALAHIVQRATREDPTDRYQSIGELMDAVGYYRQSKDPDQNPREALEGLIQRAKDMLDHKQYSREDLERILATLQNTNLENDTLLGFVHSIPTKLLPIMAEELNDQLTAVLVRYVLALISEVGGYPFSYAEAVATRMKLIFQATKSAEVKVIAIQATMVAAVSLHRFAAMDVFDEMLLAIQAAEDAIPVAEMLSRNISTYQSLADRIPADRLSPAIRAVQTVAMRSTGER